jgi:hypothetical protein
LQATKLDRFSAVAGFVFPFFSLNVVSWRGNLHLRFNLSYRFLLLYMFMDYQIVSVTTLDPHQNMSLLRS